ncbi:hypothetical protein GOP47_0022021 [Adiantum capillus-veneris]|uniref:Uncharacterized protein n=1 Tax=Adiantum capillus-veneris TaxID=13818 RepID=A0A9D4Z6R0_ADICA|nr:hypothetical protein GOP47_0022021 [Adiantum capillus-veneris]
MHEETEVLQKVTWERIAEPEETWEIEGIVELEELEQEVTWEMEGLNPSEYLPSSAPPLLLFVYLEALAS